MKKWVRVAGASATIFLVFIFLCPSGIWAQEANLDQFERATLISAARELMEAARYCALITVDNTGHPQVRTMDPFSPGEDMVVWMGTNVNSRKVGEIRDDSRVTLYYEAKNGGGYVVLKGKGFLIDDPEKVKIYWKAEWDQFYPDKYSTFTLIKVIPEELEIIDYEHGIVSSSLTWSVPNLKF